MHIHYIRIHTLRSQFRLLGGNGGVRIVQHGRAPLLFRVHHDQPVAGVEATHDLHTKTELRITNMVPCECCMHCSVYVLQALQCDLNARALRKLPGRRMNSASDLTAENLQMSTAYTASMVKITRSPLVPRNMGLLRTYTYTVTHYNVNTCKH